MSQSKGAFREVDSGLEKAEVPLHLGERHLLIIEDSLGRRKIELDKFVYSIGRDPKCNICLWSEFASRHHATLVQLSSLGLDSGYYRIIDGDLDERPSTNGIFVNGRRVKAHDLENEDQIIFGFQTRAIYYHLSQESDVDSIGDLEKTVISSQPDINKAE
ncbi:MAG: FHA domain-containing protein [Cyanobacteria bacterium]|nr:FHA domain-containing protein [Cyanobacteriota bacterium]MDA0866753.1 FHA domain-containing protein [Cyanobacteriota bacterium]